MEANKATTPYGINPITKSATQEIMRCNSSNNLVKLTSSLVPVCLIKRAMPPMITPNTTTAITFVSAIAFTGLLGINARNVSITGFTSRILALPSTGSRPVPRPKALPNAKPTIAATATIPRFVDNIATTNFFRFVP